MVTQNIVSINLYSNLYVDELMSSSSFKDETESQQIKKFVTKLRWILNQCSFHQDSGSQSVVSGPVVSVAPETLLEMITFSPCPRIPESGIWGWRQGGILPRPQVIRMHGQVSEQPDSPPLLHIRFICGAFKNSNAWAPLPDQLLQNFQNEAQASEF